MLLEARAEDFFEMLKGRAPNGVLTLASSELAPVPVLEMLAQLSAQIAALFAPNAWMIVEDECLAGLVTLVAVPTDGAVTIGYGVTDSHRGCGVASRAVAQLLELMRADERVNAVLAETSVANPASQHVLRVNGFDVTGERDDPEDGLLICWCKALR